MSVRTCLFAWGSRGDVQPFVALAQGMQAAGMDVAVAAGDDFEPLVSAAGVDFEPLGLSMQDLMADPVVRRWLTGSSHSLRAEMRHMSAVGNTFQRPAIDALVRLAGRYDGFVSGILTADALASVAHALGKRHVIALLTPGLPTRVAAAQMFPVVARDSQLNHAGGTLGSYVTLRLGAAIRHGVEHELGLPRRRLREQLKLLSSTPTLLGASAHVVPRAADWGDEVALTGCWRLPTPTHWEPSAELGDFVAASPVHIGLGSMPVVDPRGFGALLEESLSGLGLHATVQGNWEGSAPQGERFLAVGDVPHAWLFPRVRAVVHHGGAGTSAASFEAGVPQLAVPHMGDQPYWGRRIVDLGCGPSALRLHELSVDSLTERLARLVAGGYDQRAGELGSLVRAEDGVGQAVTRLQRWWG